MAIRDVDDLRGMLDTEILAEITRLETAMRRARAYAAEIEQDAITSLQSLRASLIQEVIDRALGDYPPAAAAEGAMSTEAER